MRKNDVFALIIHADNDLRGDNLKNIERQYLESLASKIISPALQIDVKNFMENLRSALDYLAHDIYETVIRPTRAHAGQKEGKVIYFPYGKTENDYKSSMGMNLPGLEVLNIAAFDAVESIQLHKSGDDWLYQFCRIVNEKKHDVLTPQIRTEAQSMTASAGGASITVPINNPNFSIQQGSSVEVTFDGVPIILSNQGIKPLAPGLERTVTTWVSFEFADTKIHVLPMLKIALEKIKKISQDIYSAIEPV